MIMDVLEKLGFKKPDININEEISLTEFNIQQLEARIKAYERLGTGKSEDLSVATGNIENMKAKLKGLQDKLSLLQEKKRHEEEKAGQR